MAGFIKSIPSKSRELHSRRESEIAVRSHGPKRSQLYIHSAPLTREVLQHMRQLQLETIAHDQGWATGSGSWTWFEIVILTPVTGEVVFVDDSIELPGLEHYQVKMDPSNPTRRLQWESHRNPRAKGSWNHIKGPIFTPHHEIWNHLDENDILGVTVVAQYGGWTNTVSDARIQFWDKFDPTLLG
ncbi:hypothetical protein CPB86DRAFT_796512 [Serendipita vermifera]|nr:hypothetical protein CPB86DRAFT_796512 [Serendipita vermifera]